MDKKIRPVYILPLQYLSQIKTYTQTKNKKWKKIFHAKGKEKAGVAVLMLDKIDFKAKAIVGDKKGHYIMIKGTTQQEDT